MKKSVKIDFKSIKFKVWIMFMIFSVLIIGLLWISQVIFLSYYTDRYKKNEFTVIADELSDRYAGDYKPAFSRIANKHGCMVEVIVKEDDDYVVEYTTNGLGYGVSGQKIKDVVAIVSLVESISDGAYFVKDSSSSSYKYAEYLSDSENVILILSQSTEVADSTVKILQIQMWIVTITIIVLAFCVSFIMSGALGREISQLSQGAKKFAESDYSVVFPEKGTTEIAEISATLNYAVKEVSKVEGLRRELIANVSHDLRTPLTLIKGYAELIRDISGDDRDKRNANLAVIIKETDRLTTLVNDMLELAKLEGSKQEIELQPLCISNMIKEAANSFLILNQKDGFNITYDIEPNLYVNGDVTRLQIATYNLIGNAVNYTGDDKLVEIKLYSQDGKAVFSVRDSGEGISQEKKQLIWERYYRAKEHKRSISGSGLGLSIVKNVLEAHNAEFDVDSVVGEGSTFWYKIPLLTLPEIEK